MEIVVTREEKIMISRDIRESARQYNRREHNGDRRRMFVALKEATQRWSGAYARWCADNVIQGSPDALKQAKDYARLYIYTHRIKQELWRSKARIQQIKRSNLK